MILNSRFLLLSDKHMQSIQKISYVVDLQDNPSSNSLKKVDFFSEINP